MSTILCPIAWCQSDHVSLDQSGKYIVIWCHACGHISPTRKRVTA